MKSSTYIGNCNSIINWNSIIAELQVRAASTIGPKFGEGYKDKYMPEHVSDQNAFDETAKLWVKSGYVDEGDSAQWHMFYPDVDFDRAILDKFVDFYKIDNFQQCWISMIMPGKCAPWHIDQYADEHYDQRYHCHIGQRETGHVFMIDNDYYIHSSQGDAYKWSNHRDWHAGFNAGRTPKFLFNLY